MRKYRVKNTILSLLIIKEISRTPRVLNDFHSAHLIISLSLPIVNREYPISPLLLGSSCLVISRISSLTFSQVILFFLAMYYYKGWKLIKKYTFLLRRKFTWFIYAGEDLIRLIPHAKKRCGNNSRGHESKEMCKRLGKQNCFNLSQHFIVQLLGWSCVRWVESVPWQYALNLEVISWQLWQPWSFKTCWLS